MHAHFVEMERGGRGKILLGMRKRWNETVEVRRRGWCEWIGMKMSVHVDMEMWCRVALISSFCAGNLCCFESFEHPEVVGSGNQLLRYRPLQESLPQMGAQRMM